MKISSFCTILLVMCASLLLTCCSCGCCWYSSNPKVWVEEEDQLSLPVAGIEEFEVNTYNGYVTVEADEGTGGIEVLVKKRAGGKDHLDARECMENIKLVTDQIGSIQQLGWDWAIDRDEAGKRGWGACISFEVRLPPDLVVRAQSYNGDVAVSGVLADARLKSYNGDLRVSGHEGDLEVNTYNGRIEVVGNKGTLKAYSYNQDVTITGQEGDLGCESYNGDLDIEALAEKVRLSSYNGDITARLGSVPALEGKTYTYNGDIRLKVAGEPSTRFCFKTYNGSIHTEKPMKISMKDRRRVIAESGSGDATLEMESYNGSLRLD